MCVFVFSDSTTTDDSSAHTTTTTATGDGDSGCVVFVGNARVHARELRELFEPYGVVRKTWKTAKPYGLVTMSSREEALAAIESLNGRRVGGQQLRVALKTTPTSSPSSSPPPET